MYATGT